MSAGKRGRYPAVVGMAGNKPYVSGSEVSVLSVVTCLPIGQFTTSVVLQRPKDYGEIFCRPTANTTPFARNSDSAYGRFWSTRIVDVATDNRQETISGSELRGWVIDVSILACHTKRHSMQR